MIPIKKLQTDDEITARRRCPRCKSLSTRFVGKAFEKKKLVCSACGYDEREIEAVDLSKMIKKNEKEE